jgi:ion channel-forming bestrophin family protein
MARAQFSTSILTHTTNDAALAFTMSRRRNMARLVTLNMTPLNARMCSVLIVCYAHSLAQRLQLSRSDEPCRSLLAQQSTDMADRISRAPNKPLECTVALGQVVRDDMRAKEQRIDSQRGNTLAERAALESCIGQLVDHLGACERICSTPVPLSYSRHTTRLLSLFLITLPLVLVGQPGGTFYTVPSVVFVTWALSGIDEVAHLIEDPFLGKAVSLQLEQICAKIQRDVLEQVSVGIRE